jgi:hypothetical protein
MMNQFALLPDRTIAVFFALLRTAFHARSSADPD